MPHLLQLLLLLVIIVVCAKAAGALSVRFGQPAVFGEILIGLLLGPTFLDVLHLGVFARGAEAYAALNHTLKDLAEIGVILLMFVAGLETDLVEMKRVGRAAFWAATGGVILPMLGGALVARGFGYGWREAIFIGTVLTATSVSISAQTLMELKQLRSKEGSTILGAAVIDDVMGIIVLSFVVAFAAIGNAQTQTDTTLPQLLALRLFDGSKLAELSLVVVLMTAFFVLATWFGWQYFEALLDRFARTPASQALLAGAVALALFYAFIAQYVGQVAAITGSYLAGVLMARTRFKHKIDEGIHPLTYSFFVPVFFISIGLEANGRELLADTSKLGLLLAILLVAIIGKIVGSGAGARFCGFTNQEALRVGIGMISRGEVGLIVAGVGLSSGVIGQQVFSIMVIMVLVTTMVTPLLLRRVFPLCEEAVGVEVYESVAGMGETEESLE
ncbi:MAG: cation:proton antiporter [Acidobacteria bacterium]|nr:cation:proton antiporter [Acidobacteriota bacterium]MBI3428250.1 cation:proton antiporter [Acidobacteriota bacterium]